MGLAGQLWDAWWGLAAAAWPYFAVACALGWLWALAVAGELAGSASAKAYALEQRVSALVAASLPAAVQPGSSPAAPETWHDFPAGVNGWGLGTGGWKKYRLLAEGSVEVSINLNLIGTKTDNTLLWNAGGLPAGYQPPSGKYLPASLDTAAATFYAANHTPYLVFRSDGSVACYGVNATGLSQLQCHGIFSLV